MQCPSCHIENKSDSFYCAACGAKLHEGDRLPVIYAGFWKRLGACFLDGMIMGIVNFVIMAVIGGVMGASAMSGNGLSPQVFTFIGLMYGACIVLNWLYFTVMESSSYQGSLGKMALGIVVTDMDGQRISFARANGRYWSKIISGMTLLVGYIMAAFTEKKQALHDVIASTLVVDK